MAQLNILNNLCVALKTNYIALNKYSYVRYNKFLINVLFLLYKDGLINGYEIMQKEKKVKLKLKYIKNKPFFDSFYILFKPNLRNNYNKISLKKFIVDYHYVIFSTTKGLISLKGDMKTNNINGYPILGIKFKY